MTASVAFEGTDQDCVPTVVSGAAISYERLCVPSDSTDTPSASVIPLSPYRRKNGTALENVSCRQNTSCVIPAAVPAVANVTAARPETPSGSAPDCQLLPWSMPVAELPAPAVHTPSVAPSSPTASRPSPSMHARRLAARGAVGPYQPGASVCPPTTSCETGSVPLSVSISSPSPAMEMRPAHEPVGVNTTFAPFVSASVPVDVLRFVSVSVCAASTSRLTFPVKRPRNVYEPVAPSRWTSCPVEEVNTTLSENPAVLSVRDVNFCDPVTRSNVMTSPFSNIAGFDPPAGSTNVFGQLRW